MPWRLPGAEPAAPLRFDAVLNNYSARIPILKVLHMSCPQCVKRHRNPTPHIRPEPYRDEVLRDVTGFIDYVLGGG
jgi:hypothetical protein